MELKDVAYQFAGTWLPQGDTHMEEMLSHPAKAIRIDGRPAYQGRKQLALKEAAGLAYPGEWHRGCFVDVGAHVGLWSMWWVQWMRRVVAFEPIVAFAPIFEANMGRSKNFSLINAAATSKPGPLFMEYSITHTGDTHIVPETFAGKLKKVAGVRMDDVIGKYLQDRPIKVMKLDCEGHELEALQGGETTIRNHLPVICVEQKKGAPVAVEYLAELGYRLHTEISGDFIMLPPK